MTIRADNVNPIVTIDDIARDIRELGVGAGDIVFFHSSLKSVGDVKGGADALIDAFSRVLGEDGTLVLPALCLYDWENMSYDDIERAWDIRTRPTFTGIVPETFRKRNGVIRSDNPTHSVTAFGAKALEITRGHRDVPKLSREIVGRPKWLSDMAFGVNSPWEKLRALNAKYLFIGVDFSVCTMLHHVQILLLQNAAPDAALPKFNFREMGMKLEARGLVRSGKIGAAPAKWIPAGTLVDTALAIYRQENP